MSDRRRHRRATRRQARRPPPARRRHGWTVGVYVLLVVLVLYWRSSDRAAVGPVRRPVARDRRAAARVRGMGQAIVIISGGIDLSIGSLMSLVNVVAARWMVDDEPPRSDSLFMLLLVHRVGALAGASPGADRRDARRGHHRHARDAVRLGGRGARGARRSPAAASRRGSEPRHGRHGRRRRGSQRRS